jgi:hypothetical protein
MAGTRGSGERKELCGSLRKLHTAAKEARRGHEDIWNSLSKYVVTRSQKVVPGASKGSRRDTNIYDSTAIQANGRFASTLSFLITNQSTDWIGTEIRNKAARDSKPFREYVDNADSEMLSACAESNFYPVADEFFMDYSGMGTGIMFVEEGKPGEPHIVCKSLPLFECSWTENRFGVPDALYREYTLTVHQIVSEWGLKNVNRKVSQLYKDKENWQTEITILHSIFPRKMATSMLGRRSRNFEYASVYMIYEGDNSHVLEESGYSEQPFMIARYRKASGETVGRGPGEECLADIITLNTMSKTNLKIARKNADPAWDHEANAYIGRLKTGANAVNIRQRGYEPAKPMTESANLPFALEMEDRRRDSIKKSFYVDVLQIPQHDRMTTVEIEKYREEAMQILGPAFGRICFEFLQPLIVRIWGILYRKGVFGESPIPLRPGMFVIRYNSPLARAQKAQDLLALDRALGRLGPYMEIARDEILDWVDFDEITQWVFRLEGVKNKLVRSKDDVAARRAQRAEQQMQERMMMMAQMGAKTMKDASGADMGNLERMAG